MSAICLLITTALTLAMIAVKAVPPLGAIDVIVFIILGVFIYLGHRWACLAAMAFWTLEKGILLMGAFSVGKSGTVVGHVIWWCIFMHAFYLSFRVEQARRKAPKLDVSVFSD